MSLQKPVSGLLHGFGEADPLLQAQLRLRPLRTWDVSGGEAPTWLALDADFDARMKGAGDAVRELSDPDRFLGANIVGSTRGSLEEDGPKPNRKIGRVEVGA